MANILDNLFNEGIYRFSTWLDKKLLHRFCEIAHENNVSSQESNDNLQKYTIELVNHGKHMGNGLVITENGYFLTAKHCVEANPMCPGKKLLDLTANIGDRDDYLIYDILATSNHDDLALGRLMMSGNRKAIRYKFSEPDEVTITGVITRWDRKFNDEYTGQIVYPNVDEVEIEDGRYKFKNQFSINKPSRPGVSGGIVVCRNKGLLGIASNSSDHTEINGYTNVSKMSTALRMIDYYVREG